jgi:hypothetical protein
MSAKKRKIDKSNVIIVLIIGALVAIICAFGYIIWHNNNQSPQPADNAIAIDKAPQYGACELTTTNTIKKSFEADRIITISEGVRIGEKQLNNTIGEGCMFSFSTKESNANSLTASVYDYLVGDENGGGVEIVGENWSEVGGSNPIAYFGEATENDGQTTVYMYRILPGSKNILLALRQPSNAITFDREDAFNFIGGIAASLNLSVVNEKINGDSPETFEPGGITDNP